MNKLFEVLEELHPGYKVVDVRFSLATTLETMCNHEMSFGPTALGMTTASARQEEPLDLQAMDEQMAHAVRTAKQVDIAALCAAAAGR